MALKPKRTKKERYSKAYLANLKAMDFMGHLTPDEVEIAKENGLLKWDLWKKSMRTIPYRVVFHEKDLAVAPILDGFGGIDPEKTYDTKRYVINNYAELENYKVENG